MPTKPSTELPDVIYLFEASDTDLICWCKDITDVADILVGEPVRYVKEPLQKKQENLWD